MHKAIQSPAVWPYSFRTHSDAVAFYFQANPKADRVTAEAAVSRMVRDGEISVGNLRVESL